MLRLSFWNRLIPYFPLTALLIVSLTAFGVYVKERNAAAAPVLLELEQATQLKQQQVKRWFQEQKNNILVDADAEILQQSAQVLLTTRITSKPEYKAAYKAISDYFAAKKSLYRTAALLTNGGIVIFSTDPDREGEYQPLQNTTTYFEAKDIDRVVPNFYVAANTGKPSITLATPILTQENRRLGALAIDLDLEALDRLIRSPIQVLEDDKNYLGETGETYLVGRISPIENAFIGAGSRDIKTRHIVSKGIALAMQGSQISGLYLNYLKQPVLGAYAWLDQENLVLVAETQQSEVFQVAQSRTQTLFFTGLMMTTILSAIVLFFQEKSDPMESQLLVSEPMLVSEPSLVEKPVEVVEIQSLTVLKNYLRETDNHLDSHSTKSEPESEPVTEGTQVIDNV